MTEKPQIECPKCGTMIALDEGLAGPLIAKIKAESAVLIAQGRDEVDKRLAAVATAEAAIATTRKKLAELEAGIQTTINQKISAERASIVAAERENLRKELAPALQAEQAKAAKLTVDLQTAQAAELKLRSEKDDLARRETELKLTVARQVDAQRKGIQEEAEKTAADHVRLLLLDKDNTIRGIQQKLEEAQRTSNQGSQQGQGDVLEVDFEAALRQAFPQDTIAPVKAGVRGGDILQHVLGEMGRPVGTLFWETKRTNAWSNEWISKAKKDAAEAKAEVIIIISESLPKDTQKFGTSEGVWIARPEYGVMLAVALRHGVVCTAEARQRALGKETKAERLYEYMMGPEFHSMIEGIALPFIAMKAELTKEQTATISRWKRQEKRLEQVLFNVAGLKGDLQGIGGMDMLELPGFEETAEGED